MSMIAVLAVMVLMIIGSGIWSLRFWAIVAFCVVLSRLLHDLRLFFARFRFNCRVLGSLGIGVPVVGSLNHKPQTLNPKP